MAAVPIGPFVRFIIAASAAAYANWDQLSGLFQRQQELTTAPIFGMYCQHVFQMQNELGAFSDRERGMFGVHYLNTTGGDLDPTWTTADYLAVEAAIEGAWNTWKPNASSSVRLVEHRWYPYGPGVLPPNPPQRVQTLVTPSPGTGNLVAPFQVASTITLRTPLRRHWGRIYLPMFNPPLTANGQISNAAVSSMVTQWKNGLTGAATSQGIVPVVYDRNRHAVLGVTSYEADSVPDIIRRRRPRATAFKSVLTA